MENREIDGIKFIINKFNPMEALQVERKIMSILIPVVSGLFSGNDKESKNLLDSQLDFGSLGESFQKAFGSLSELEFEQLVIKTLNKVQAEIPEQPPIQINNIGNFNIVFANAPSLLTVYKLIFEVMKVNKFCFFGLLGDGIGINITDILMKQLEKTEKKQKK